MDVARRPSSSQPARMAVRPAPRTPQATTPVSQSAEPVPVERSSQPQPQPKPNTQPILNSGVPVGVIVMVLLAMMVLSVLAVIIYLTSQV